MTGGYLTQEMITAALDDLWNGGNIKLGPGRPWDYGMPPCPVYPACGPPVPLEVPELDWTVQAGGWKLVIRDGAIRGLKEIL